MIVKRLKEILSNVDDDVEIVFSDTRSGAIDNYWSIDNVAEIKLFSDEKTERNIICLIGG